MLSKVISLLVIVLPLAAIAADPPPRFDRQIAPLLKTHCVKCHGPAKREAGLNLSTAAGVARGGKKGAVVAPHDIAASKLWERVDNDDMPPDAPLGDDEKDMLRRWIAAGAPGLPTVDPDGSADRDHWSFQRLPVITPPTVQRTDRVANDVDRFIQAALESQKLSSSPEADRSIVIRRVSLDLTGLPPTLAELDEFLADKSSGAYGRLVDSYLASPHYGERWGKYWLDAAGYADSNGYFNADSDRPLAYRYRDYVVRAFNADRPFDQFIREQIAGDELAKFEAGQVATPEVIELLEATHFLRNAQDGSGESDGNPDEVRIDRYTPLEGVMQITASSLLGLTIQCAKCHSHKFEPISHQDYYQWQAVFYPAFDIDNWVKPNDRIVYAPLPGEQERWELNTRELDEHVNRSRAELVVWVQAHRLRGEVLFEDTFDAPDSVVSERWSATAPGDDAPGGKVPVNLDSEALPAASVKEGRMQIVEGNTDGSSWLSTKQAFDWTPEQVGESIQVTFDLVDNKLAPDAAAAQRIGYYLALHDFNDNSPTAGGNLLIDGNPGGSTAVHLDYPGDDDKGVGEIGTTAYTPGRNYGIRVTNLGDDKYRLEQFVDAIPDEKPLDLKAADLPDGGFGFEYCCGRSFLVDNIRIERFPAPGSDGDSPLAKFRDELKSRKDAHSKLLAEQKDLAGRRPGKIAWTTDMQPTPPEVHLLERGNYSTPGPLVDPGTLSVLADSAAPFAISPAPPGAKSSGRRLAWANWVTEPGSRAASLMARVQVNRIWQQHFGTGIVATPENFGFSGAPPSHPDLLDWLAAEFIRSGWSVKAIHRLILNSAAYRQTSEFSKPAHEADPDNRLLWRFPIRRLEAEAIRDAMLAVSGDLDPRLGGPYVPTIRNESGEVLVNESTADARRRSLYLYQRRTQVLSFLAVFDTPTIVFNSLRRTPSTIPLQSLALLNSDFAVTRARSFSARLQQMELDESRRVTLAYRLLFAREPTPDESAEALRFLDKQMPEYSEMTDPRSRVWQDFCQSLLASNEFLYVE
ncbi:MAG: DUF1553 domain-containing protein [Planctomycetaceae bacterium]|nr:DUF1553 domain-containing protein [Planctomycetaceae bacterium]